MDSTPTSNSSKAVTSDGIYEYVNSSVATNTAYFIGTFASVAELEAYSGIITNNDYAFVTSTDSAGNTLYNRYKYNGSTQTWSFEYALNNSSFTSAQWATIQSGLTASDKTKLDGIEAGANKTIVDSAMSSSSTNPVQNKVVYTALSGKQDTLTFDSTPTQSSTNPVTSAGIWTDQQRQETEIGVVANAGAKNYAVPFNPISTTDIAVTLNADGSYTFVCTNVSENRVIRVASIGDLPSGSYKFSGTTGGSSSTYMLGLYNTSSTAVKYQHTSPEETYTGNVSGFSLRVRVISGYSGTFTVYPMLRPAAITDPTFQPFSRTNRELTVLTDEDRASLIELVDGGAKNLLQFTGASTPGRNGLTYDIQDGIFTVSGTPTDPTVSSYVTLQISGTGIDVSTYCDGNHVLSGCPLGGSSDKYQLYAAKGSSYRVYDTGEGVVLYSTSLNSIYLVIAVYPNYYATLAQNPIVFRPMICTKAAWDVSHAYQPYRPSWQDMADSNKIINITSQITAESGYTVESTSHLYLQNNIVFGSIAIAKDSGNYSSSLTAVAKLPEKYAPISQFINMCGFSTEQWGVTNIGYAFIQTQNATSASQRGQISVKSPTANLNHLLLQVNYPIRLDDTLLSGASTQSVQPTLMSAAKPMIDAEEVSEKEAEPEEQEER